jgi:hypothetical protein
MFGRAKPLPKRLAIADEELRQRIRDVELDCVDADSPASGNFAIRHAVLHGMHDAPFGRRQQIIVRRSAATVRLRPGRAPEAAPAR